MVLFRNKNYWCLSCKENIVPNCHLASYLTFHNLLPLITKNRYSVTLMNALIIRYKKYKTSETTTALHLDATKLRKKKETQRQKPQKLKKMFFMFCYLYITLPLKTFFFFIFWLHFHAIRGLSEGRVNGLDATHSWLVSPKTF